MMNRKRLIYGSLLVLSLLTISVGWTMAWLTAESKSINNIFTVGSVQVQLLETFNTDKDKDGKMDSWEGVIVPGTALSKDPKVIVPNDCEDSWVYVQVQEIDWPKFLKEDSCISYIIEDGWKPLPDYASVYYREIHRDDSIREFSVLKQDVVTVNDSFTKQEIHAIMQPKLIISAYAIQQPGFSSPVDAWQQINTNV